MKRFLFISQTGIITGLLFLSLSVSFAQNPNLQKNEFPSTRIETGSLIHNSRVLHISFPEINTNTQIINGETFSEISMSGCGYTTLVGSPKLPAFTRLIEIPIGKKLEVVIETIEKNTIENILPYPCQKSQNRNDYLDNKPFEFHINRDSYKESFPDNTIEVSDIQFIGASRVVTLTIYPVISESAENRISVINSIQIRLNYITDDQSKLEKSSVVNNHTSEIFNNDLLIQYDNISRGTLEIDPPKMLIITNDLFYNSILPFAEWKNMKGIQTRIVKLSQLANKREPQDIKNLIVSFLKDSADMMSLDYVLLVGDVDYIPAFSGVYETLTDHDYATINGEDFLPDIMVGRFSCNSVEECDIYVQKSINYERNIAVSDSNLWYKNAVVAASNSHLDDLHGRHIVSVFRKKEFNQVDDLRQSKQRFTNYEIYNGLNKGRSWVFYIGHGDETGWLATGVFSKNTIEKNLTFRNSLPAIVSVACLNSDLDFDGGECFAEKFMNTGVDKGAIVFLGATELTPFFLSDTLGKYALISYINGETETFGEAMIYGKMKMYESFTDNSVNSETKETMQQFLILGDPTIMPWTDVPKNLTVSYPKTIKTGFQQVEFNVKADGINVKKALVCLTNPIDKKYYAAYTDEKGNATIGMQMSDTCNLHVVISGKNLATFENNILVSNTVSVPSSKNENNLVVYPNPFSNNTVVTFGNSIIYSVEILDLQGKTLQLTENLNSNRVNINRNFLNNGLYILKVTDLNGNISQSRLSIY